jgi:uncharacterized ubiquitin-like protein YukD
MKVVQVGSNKGNDDLSKYLLSNFNKLEFGLFVEAIPLHIPDLKKCYSKYPNIIIENVAITPPTHKEKTVDFYFLTSNGPDYGISSCSEEHIKEHINLISALEGGKILKFNLPCITLENLLDKYEVKDLDLLLLDLEGIDAEIILTFDWKKYNIKRVEFEYIHLKNKTDIIKNLFLDMGYKQIKPIDTFNYDWAFEK